MQQLPDVLLVLLQQVLNVNLAGNEGEVRGAEPPCPQEVSQGPQLTQRSWGFL